MRKLSAGALWGLTVLIILSLTSVAGAREVELIYAGDEPAGYLHYEQYGHITTFETPLDFDEHYVTKVSVFARRYGTGEGFVTVVLFDSDNKPIARQILRYEEFSFQGGWVEVSFLNERVPELFKVGVFTASNDVRGVEVGWTEPQEEMVHSQYGHPVLDLYDFPEGEEKEWMIKVTLVDRLLPKDYLAPEDLPTGNNILYHDSGQISGVARFGKVGVHDQVGPLVKFGEEGKKYKIKAIYLAAKAAGEWYRSDKNFAIHLIRGDLTLIDTFRYPFSIFTSVPAWVRLDVPRERIVEGPFYIQVSGRTVPGVELLVGYDQSGNQGTSFVGLPGAIKTWSVEPEERLTNWLIRVEVEEVEEE